VKKETSIDANAFTKDSPISTSAGYSESDYLRFAARNQAANWQRPPAPRVPPGRNLLPEPSVAFPQIAEIGGTL
jgi:hypothetical protein